MKVTEASQQLTTFNLNLLLRIMWKKTSQTILNRHTKKKNRGIVLQTTPLKTYSKPLFPCLIQKRMLELTIVSTLETLQHKQKRVISKKLMIINFKKKRKRLRRIIAAVLKIFLKGALVNQKLVEQIQAAPLLTKKDTSLVAKTLPSRVRSMNQYRFLILKDLNQKSSRKRARDQRISQFLQTLLAEIVLMAMLKIKRLR